MPKTRTAPKRSVADGKAAWAARSDRGPHKATLPSRTVVEFIVPDSNALIRADMLPDHLSDVAVMAAGYPDGADGYFEDLSRVALRDPSQMPTLRRSIKEGLELRDWLVAHMLVEPSIDPEDVVGLPERDVAMLVDFAERRRNEDADGVRLPIVLLEEYARFRDGSGGRASDGVGEGVGAGVPGADGGSDGGDV